MGAAARAAARPIFRHGLVAAATRFCHGVVAPARL